MRHAGPHEDWPQDWQKAVANVVMAHPCNVIAELWDAKAAILDGLGRGEEAKALRSRYEGVDPLLHDDIYQRVHSRLRELRLKPAGSGGKTMDPAPTAG